MLYYLNFFNYQTSVPADCPESQPTSTINSRWPLRFFILPCICPLADVTLQILPSISQSFMSGLDLWLVRPMECGESDGLPGPRLGFLQESLHTVTILWEICNCYVNTRWLAHWKRGNRIEEGQGTPANLQKQSCRMTFSWWQTDGKASKTRTIQLKYRLMSKSNLWLL